MKKLLALMLMIPAFAYAERWLEMPNNAGGKIILTEYKCPDNDNGRLSIATTKEGKTAEGCWFYFTEMVHVVWKTGERYTYEPTSFVAKEKK